MNKKYLLSLLPIALMVSCGTVNRGVKSNVEVVKPKTEQKSVVLYPELHGAVDSLRPFVAIEPNIADTRVNRAYPKMIFSSVQSANVKHNDKTLPKLGMKLDLDELSKEFTFPFNSRVISDYGMRGRRIHTGIDIKSISSDTIRAVFDGVVRMSKGYSGYGNVIVIRHYNGLETVYAHNRRNLVKVNDVVRSGDPISLEGRTGRATTEHLHFEVRVDGEYFSPHKLVDFEKKRLQKGYLTIKRPNNGSIVAVLSSADIKENMPYDMPTFSDSKPTPSSANKKYHKIVSGDTLYGIALKNKTTVASLCKLNGITKNTILKLGKTLRVK